MELVGIKVRVRPLQADDLLKMVHWNNDPDVQYFVDSTLPGDPNDLKRWYGFNVPDRHYQIFAIEKVDGELIGDMELDHICWNTKEAELRIRIGEKHYWGEGYGSEAIRLVVMDFMNNKKFNRIYLKVYHFNLRAIRCYQKNGFRPVGILQRNVKDWKDIILMELNRVAFQKRYKTTVAG